MQNASADSQYPFLAQRPRLIAADNHVFEKVNGDWIEMCTKRHDRGGFFGRKKEIGFGCIMENGDMLRIVDLIRRQDG